MIPTIEELMAFLKQDTRVRSAELVVNVARLEAGAEYVIWIYVNSYGIDTDDMSTLDKIEIKSDTWTALCVLVGDHPLFSSNYAARAHDAIWSGDLPSVSAYGKLGTYAAHKREENG